MATRAKGRGGPAKPQAPATEGPAGRRPAALRLAAAALLIQAAGLCVAGVFAAVGTAVIAVALARAKAWSRTPTAIIQLFVVIGGITLLDGNRPAWGVPALALA